MEQATAVTYRRDLSLSELLDLDARGVPVLCWRCGSRLLFALSPEQAARVPVHPGIYCTADAEHLSILVETQRDPSFWDRFK